jgi:Chaperone of endosialidase
MNVGGYGQQRRTSNHFTIALGYNAGANITSFTNNIDIGNAGVAREANKTRIGAADQQTATYIAGISGGHGCKWRRSYCQSDGQLGTITSSARFKDDVKPLDKVSEAILALKPVTFRYKHELDPDGIPQFGLVAEQFEAES